MSERPDISVIIPTLNEASELEGTIDSVLEAFGDSAEIIVVDGGSTDGTADRARRRAQVIRSAPGRGRQLNAGAATARGEVLLFLHADTWLHPASAANLESALADREVVGGCFRVQLRGPTSDRWIARALAAAINLRTRWLRTASGDQAIFTRHAVFQRVGGFPTLALFEDVLFFRELRRAGRVVLLGTPVRTSDRRWRERGYLRTIADHLFRRTLFLLGVPPEQLARGYHDGRPAGRAGV